MHLYGTYKEITAEKKEEKKEEEEPISGNGARIEEILLRFFGISDRSTSNGYPSKKVKREMGLQSESKKIGYV